MTMNPLPQGGIEDAEDISGQDPARNRMDDEPYVKYSVKDLIVRLEAKLDIYVAANETNRVTLERLAPTVVELDTRVEAIELRELQERAVKNWRQDVWRLVAGTSGLMSIGALVLAFHH